MCTFERPWGHYEILKDETNFKSKRIVVNPHQKLSLQSHQFRSEHWICLVGNGMAQVSDEFIDLKPDKYVFILAGEKHRLINETDFPLVIIEIQTGSYFGEDDIIRYQDDYGRTM
jgi:mannose-1-phosphate guanylyltransferase/mannose-1-phosphate guanylyltransferase/mannose-6-phosphate isomerase